ncbi:MAG: DNA polymerase, partial [Clostridia bacterium]
MRRALLVDGHSLLFRAYHALPPLARADGTPTGAVYGFVQMLLKALEDTQVNTVVVAFDSSGPTFRHEAFEQYKANRDEAPDDFHVQTPMAKQLLDRLGVVHLERPGYEADDILGSLAVRAQKAGWEVLVLTGDRDLLQLVQPGVKVLLTTGRGGVAQMETLDADGVVKRMGVRPDQVPDLKGLMGDASDNIPGVPGIGEKSAVTLLNRYERIEEIYAHLDDIAETRFKKALNGHEPEALRSRSLATIHTELDVPPLSGGDDPFTIERTAELAEFLGTMGFDSLRRRLFETTAASPATTAGSDETAPPAIPTAALEEDLPVLTAWPADAVVGIQKASGGYILGTASGGLGRYVGEVGGGPEQRLVGFKIKEWVDEIPQAVWPRLDDGELVAYLLNPGRSRYTVAQLVQEAGGVPREDVAALAESWPTVREMLAEKGLQPLYENVELPLLHVLRRMERTGIRVDGPALDALGVELEQAIASLEREIHHLAGMEFNINSTGQLGEVLFDKLGLPAGRRTKTGYSTDAEVL